MRTEAPPCNSTHWYRLLWRAWRNRHLYDLSSSDTRLARQEQWALNVAVTVCPTRCRLSFAFLRNKGLRQARGVLQPTSLFRPPGLPSTPTRPCANAQPGGSPAPPLHNLSRALDVPARGFRPFATSMRASRRAILCNMAMLCAMAPSLFDGTNERRRTSDDKPPRSLIERLNPEGSEGADSRNGLRTQRRPTGGRGRLDVCVRGERHHLT